jgi:hypothetical protein
MDPENDENEPQGRLPRRHNSYSVAARLRHVLDYEAAIEHGQVRDVAEYARRYRLVETSLRRWITNRDTLMEQAETHGESRRIRDLGRGLWSEVEERVHEDFLDYRRRALPVSCTDLLQDSERQFQLWWNELAPQQRDELSFKRPELSHFRASAGWVHNFMHISTRQKTKDTTSLPANATERVHLFQQNVRDTVAQNQVNALYNMNETFVHLDFPPLYTAATRGERNINVRSSLGNL